jgi:hypothetical protein
MNKNEHDHSQASKYQSILNEIVIFGQGGPKRGNSFDGSPFLISKP